MILNHDFHFKEGVLVERSGILRGCIHRQTHPEFKILEKYENMFL